MAIEQSYQTPVNYIPYEVVGTGDEAVEQKNRPDFEARDQLLANMSHEVRTSLSAVTEFSDMLKHEQLSSKQIEETRVIYKACNGLVVLMKNIVGCIKEQVEKVDVNVAEYYLEPLLTEINSVISSLAEAKKEDTTEPAKPHKQKAAFYSFSQISV